MLRPSDGGGKSLGNEFCEIARRYATVPRCQAVTDHTHQIARQSNGVVAVEPGKMSALSGISLNDEMAGSGRLERSSPGRHRDVQDDVASTTA